MAGQGHILSDPRQQQASSSSSSSSEQDLLAKYYWNYGHLVAVGGGVASTTLPTDSRPHGLYDLSQGYAAAAAAAMGIDRGQQGFVAPTPPPGLQGPFLSPADAYQQRGGGGGLGTMIPSCGGAVPSLPPELTSFRAENGFGFGGLSSLGGNTPTTVIHHQPSTAAEDKGQRPSHEVIVMGMKEQGLNPAVTLDHPINIPPSDNPGSIMT